MTVAELIKWLKDQPPHLVVAEFYDTCEPQQATPLKVDYNLYASPDGLTILDTSFGICLFEPGTLDD